MGFLVKLVLCYFCLSFILAEAQRANVEIRNQIQENIEAVCFSGDRDFGTHEILPGGRISFLLVQNNYLRYPFYCNFKTSHGGGKFAIYDYELEKLCHTNCIWLISSNGPCLRLNEGPVQSKCQQWQDPQPAVLP